MNRILKILPFLLLCALVLQVMPVGAQQQMFLQRTQQSAPPPSAGLLDPDYKGSAFAAAIDVLLYGSYTATDDIPGSQTFGQQGQWSVAVLRDFDDAIKSFTPSQVADGTANTWVQALGPSDGFVRRWYDQSVTALDVSNLNHADQESTPNMPKLFDSSTGLILENGKAAMEFNSDWIVSTFSLLPQPNTIFSIATTKLSTQFRLLYDSADGVERNTYDTDGDAFAGGVLIGPKWVLNENYIHSIIYNGASSSIYRNSVLLVSGNVGSQGLTGLTIGSRFNNVEPFPGVIQSVIVYPSDQSTNRSGIETAINNEYNIYP